MLVKNEKLVKIIGHLKNAKQMQNYTTKANGKAMLLFHQEQKKRDFGQHNEEHLDYKRTWSNKMNRIFIRQL